MTIYTDLIAYCIAGSSVTSLAAHMGGMEGAMASGGVLGCGGMGGGPNGGGQGGGGGGGGGSASARNKEARMKRMRTSFKHHQLRTLKSYFAINQNPDSKDLQQLSDKTGLKKKVLQVRKKTKNGRHFISSNYW